jgi:hypothetical protein
MISGSRMARVVRSRNGSGRSACQLVICWPVTSHGLCMVDMAAHAIIPFVVLEALRAADGTAAAVDEGYGVDSAVRFGRTASVAAQITRYGRLVRHGARVDASEVSGLLRLVARRRDASLLFAEAGRRAGAWAASSHVAPVWKLCMWAIPAFARRRLGSAIVRRTARDVFDVEIHPDHTAQWKDHSGVNSQIPGVKACDVYRAATAELLRRFTEFDGALFDVTCTCDGAEVCRWSAVPPNGG